MINGAAATNTPNHVNAQPFAGIKVNLSRRVLVFANTHGGWLPTIKPQSVRNLSSDSSC
jgi:hypothetical protein